MTDFHSPRDLPSFIHKHGIEKIIAFSGGAASLSGAAGSRAQKAMEDANALFEEALIVDTLEYLGSYVKRVAVLTGGTSFGVPARASRLAKEFGFRTIGVLQASAKDKALSSETLDLRIAVDALQEIQAVEPEDAFRFGCQWGDESALFAKLLDGAVVIGGGAGTMVEIAHVLKINESRLKNRQSAKMVVPITGTGGAAEVAPYLPAKPDVRKWCMPDASISTGRAAAMLLEDRLNLHDLVSIESEPTHMEGIEHEYAE